MQISHIFSVYDRKAQYYLPLFNVRSDADAIRQFTEIVTRSETSVSLYPADYDLVGLGSMDLETGLINPEYPVRTIINGLVCLQTAHTQRNRYEKILSEQVDIEDIIADRT